MNVKLLVILMLLNSQFFKNIYKILAISKATCSKNSSWSVGPSALGQQVSGARRCGAQGCGARRHWGNIRGAQCTGAGGQWGPTLWGPTLWGTTSLGQFLWGRMSVGPNVLGQEDGNLKIVFRIIEQGQIHWNLILHVELS